MMNFSYAAVKLCWFIWLVTKYPKKVYQIWEFNTLVITAKRNVLSFICIEWWIQFCLLDLNPRNIRFFYQNGNSILCDETLLLDFFFFTWRSARNWFGSAQYDGMFFGFWPLCTYRLISQFLSVLSKWCRRSNIRASFYQLIHQNLNFEFHL